MRVHREPDSGGPWIRDTEDPGLESRPTGSPDCVCPDCVPSMKGDIVDRYRRILVVIDNTGRYLESSSSTIWGSALPERARHHLMDHLRDADLAVRIASGGTGGRIVKDRYYPIGERVDEKTVERFKRSRSSTVVEISLRDPMTVIRNRW